MKKEYIKCPYCKKKTLKELHICSHCNRLIDIKEEKQKRKSGFLFLLLVLISLGVGYYYFFKDEKHIKKETVLEDFMKVVNSIDINNEYNENKLIYARINNKNALINTKGDIITNNISKLIASYSNFSIITKKKNNDYLYYIIDNNGKIIYQDKSKIVYYPSTNSFLIGNTLYHNGIKTADNIVLNENLTYEGKLFSYNNKKEGGIIDYKGNIKYKTDIKEFLYLETPSILEMLDNNYCLINKDYKYGIVNCNTGEQIIDYSSTIIEEINHNIFERNNNTFYITNKKEIMDYIKTPLEREFNSTYFDNNTLLFGTSLLNIKNNEISNNTLVSNTEIEKNNNIKRILCQDINVYYGLQYNNEVILDCNFDNISFFSSYLNNYMSNNLYVILNMNKQVSIIDLKNNTIIDNIELYSYNSPIVVYNNDDKRYIKNINNGKEKEIKKEDLISIFDNGYELSIVDNIKMKSNKEYYDLNLEEIIIK